MVPSTFGQDESQPPTAEELYVDGTEMFESGRLLEAKELLERVNLPQLERAQRTSVIERLDEIEKMLQAMPEAELRLRKAKLLLSRDDLRQASQHLTKVVGLDGASKEQVAEANGLLEQLGARQAELKPQMPALLEASFQAYEDGNFGKSKSGLQYVFNSGVALDLDQQARLNRYLQKIYELEAVRGEFNATNINFGAFQPDEAPKRDEMTGAQDEAQGDDQETTETRETSNSESVQPIDENENPQEPQEAPSVEPAQPTQPDQPDFSDLIRQAQVAKAASLLQQAQADRKAGRYAEALQKYKNVLAIQPNNREAIEGRDVMQTLIDESEAPLIKSQTEEREVRKAGVLAEFDNLLEQAGLSRDQGDFGRALTLQAQARVLLDQNRNLLSQTEYEARRATAMAMGDDILKQERESSLAEAEAQAKEIAAIRKQQVVQLELEKKQKIAEKLISIRRLQMAQKYDEALLELKALLFIDPGNPAAQALHDVIQDVQLYKRFEKLTADRHRRDAVQSMDLFEAAQPPIDIVEYPEDWPDLSLRRQNGLAFLDSDLDRQVAQALASRHVPVDFEGVSFAKAIDFVAEVAGVNVDVDWASLEQNFIDRTTPINLKLNDSIPLETVLDRMLRKLGTDESTRPQYAISDGVLTISTKEKLQQNQITHLYDIRDLLIDVPDFTDAPSFDLESLIQNQDDRGFGRETFGRGDGSEYDKGLGERQEMIDKIKRVLTTNIDKLSWEVNGGDVGVIQELNGNLVITTTPRNHRAISNLLEKLREIRAIQINVESRFLLVNEDFFEQIGFDLDLYWGGDTFRRDKLLDPNLLPSDLFVDPRNNQIGPTSQRQFLSLFDLVGQTDANGNPVFDANGRQVIQEVLPDAGIFQAGRQQFSPQSLQQDSIGIANLLFGADGQSFAGQALAATPALSYGVTYLDNIQVDLLIEATQADRRSIQLTAPKLTFFNGQRSFMQITTSQFFVSDLQPVVGTASAGFDPTLSPLREGVVLDVEGTVSADRRYVTMTVLTTLAKVLDIKTSELPIAVGGQVVGSGDQNDILTQTAFIERPEIQISRVNTTVTVPDRGTILLGGQSIRNDIEIESGVPVLSKIPILNRFFTNRIMSTEERTLYILIRPTVIIQQENEERLFPGLQDALRGSGGIGSNF